MKPPKKPSLHCKCKKPDVDVTEGRFNCSGKYILRCKKCMNTLKPVEIK